MHKCQRKSGLLKVILVFLIVIIITSVANSLFSHSLAAFFVDNSKHGNELAVFASASRSSSKRKLSNAKKYYNDEGDDARVPSTATLSTTTSSSEPENVNQLLRDQDILWRPSKQSVVTESKSPIHDTHEMNWLDDLKHTTLTTQRERVTKLPMSVALRQFSAASWQIVKAEGNEIICILEIMASKNCDSSKETLAACALRLGTKNLLKILGQRCTTSTFWTSALPRFLRRKTANQGVDEKENAWKSLSRGTIWDSSILRESDLPFQLPYVPPENRNVSQFPPPRVCSSGCKLHPIGFGLPQSSYEQSVARTKSFAWMPLLPDGAEINIKDEQQEDLFHEMYSQSFFGWNSMRFGWETVRAHKILAAGTIPFFWDLEKCSKNSLGHYPKELLKQVLDMPGVEHMLRNATKYVRSKPDGNANFIRQGEIERSNDPAKPIFNMTRYYELADQIHAFAKKFMTSRAIAAYVLKTMGAEHAKSVVLFSPAEIDYLGLTLLHGLSDLGVDVTHVAASRSYDHLYKRVTPDGKMTRQERDDELLRRHHNGAGIASGFSGTLLDKKVKRPWHKSGASVVDHIRNKKFDAAIWFMSDSNYEYIKDAKEAGIKLGFVQHRDLNEDSHPSSTMTMCKWEGTIFVRELTERKC